MRKQFRPSMLPFVIIQNNRYFQICWLSQIMSFILTSVVNPKYTTKEKFPLCHYNLIFYYASHLCFIKCVTFLLTLVDGRTMWCECSGYSERMFGELTIICANV